ncbi:MAG: hypothetical protein AAFX93_10660 [Verrucomicrobiota bacterium]
MKLLNSVTVFIFAAGSASAAFINYSNGVTNTSNSSGPAWVGGSAMFLEIINDYGGSPLGPSGGSGDSQDGFNLFDPGGGGLDITLLSWELGSMTLYQGAGTQTQSPGPATPGFEDYRYDDQGGVAPSNLSFSYNGTLWATGYVTQFVTEVANNVDPSATGSGTAVLTAHTVAGEDFFNEVNSLSGGTNIITYTASSFSPVSATDPGTFASAGQLIIVPEPQTYGLIVGTLVLGLAYIRRRNA